MHAGGGPGGRGILSRSHSPGLAKTDEKKSDAHKQQNRSPTKFNVHGKLGLFCLRSLTYGSCEGKSTIKPQSNVEIYHITGTGHVKCETRAWLGSYSSKVKATKHF